jgi:hypothetical protein
MLHAEYIRKRHTPRFPSVWYEYYFNFVRKIWWEDIISWEAQR